MAEEQKERVSITNDGIEEKVLAVLCEELDVTPQEATPKADLIDNLGADSLALAEIGMNMEDEFGVDISDDVLTSIKTVQDAVVQVKLAVRNGGSKLYIMQSQSGKA
jgi:acyl carrier protein